MTELLAALRENRRGKGLYVEPTDRQVMQIWHQAVFFEDATAPSLPNTQSMPLLAFAQRKSIQSLIRFKVQYVVRIFSGAKGA